MKMTTANNRETCWQIQLLAELGLPVHSTLSVHCDIINSGTILRSNCIEGIIICKFVI
jgi:hypothetical protein